MPTTRRRTVRRNSPLTKAEIIAFIERDAGLAEVYLKSMVSLVARAYETAETDAARDLLELAAERIRDAHSSVTGVHRLLSRAKFGG